MVEIEALVAFVASDVQYLHEVYEEACHHRWSLSLQTAALALHASLFHFYQLLDVYLNGSFEPQLLQQQHWIRSQSMQSHHDPKKVMLMVLVTACLLMTLLLNPVGCCQSSRPPLHM